MFDIKIIAIEIESYRNKSCGLYLFTLESLILIVLQNQLLTKRDIKIVQKFTWKLKATFCWFCLSRLLASLQVVTFRGILRILWLMSLKKNNSNYNGFCARRSTTLWTRYDVILVPIRWLTACVFLLRSMREVTLRGGTERGIREKIRVGLVERENKQNDHARLIVLCNGKDSPDQKGRKRQST